MLATVFATDKQAEKLHSKQSTDLETAKQEIIINSQTASEREEAEEAKEADKNGDDVLDTEEVEALFDTNEDHKITVGELKGPDNAPEDVPGLYDAATPDTTVVTAEQIINALDVADGILQTSEAEVFYTLGKAATDGKLETAELEALFDTNKDGSITVGELRAQATVPGTVAGLYSVASIVVDLDADNVIRFTASSDMDILSLIHI